MKTKKTRKLRGPKLKQVMPPPLFQIIEPEAGNDHCDVVIRDNQSDDKIHFECRQPGWSEDDLVKAGGRELANGEDWVAVQRVENGIPIAAGIYAVRFAFDRWHIQPVRQRVSAERAGVFVKPPFVPIISGTTYEVYRVGKRYNPVTRQWIALADAAAHVPGLNLPLVLQDYKTLMALAEAHALQLGYVLTTDNLPTI